MYSKNVLFEDPGTPVHRLSNFGEPRGPDRVGILGLQVTKKNRCGAAKTRARKARLEEAPSGDSSGGRPRSALTDQPHSAEAWYIWGSTKKRICSGYADTPGEWWTAARPE